MGTVNTLLCANTLAAVLPLNEHKEKLIIPNAEKKKSHVLRIGKIAPGDKRKGIPKEPVLKQRGYHFKAAKPFFDTLLCHEKSTGYF